MTDLDQLVRRAMYAQGCGDPIYVSPAEWAQLAETFEVPPDPVVWVPVSETVAVAATTADACTFYGVRVHIDARYASRQDRLARA